MGLIVIDMERCDGCGACLEVCPEGAIYLVDGRATVDRALCRDCESCAAACAAACPTQAITLAPSEATLEPGLVPVPQPQPGVVRVGTRPAPAPLRARVLPAVGAALVWAGREIVPRLADVLLEGLDQWAAEKRVTSTPRKASGNGSSIRGNGRNGDGGRRHRRRRRGG